MEDYIGVLVPRIWPTSAVLIATNSFGGCPINTSGFGVTLTAAWGLGAELRRKAEQLATSRTKASPGDLLYCEKRGGFQCRTCKYAVAVNATHGTCRIMDGTVHLDEGCCALWDADPVQLHLYREPTS